MTDPEAALAEFQRRTGVASGSAGILPAGCAENGTRRQDAGAPSLIIDGLFGIGLNRPLDDGWKKFIAAVNASKIPVLSVDVPSGLNADTGENFRRGD